MQRQAMPACKDCASLLAAGIAESGGDNMMTLIWWCFLSTVLKVRGENPRSDLNWLYLAMAMFLRRYLDEGIARMCSDLFFRVKT